MHGKHLLLLLGLSCAPLLLLPARTAAVADESTPAAASAYNGQVSTTGAGDEGRTQAPSPTEGVSQVDEAAAASAAPAPTFDVWEYRVLGNASLDSRVVEKAVYPHLGPARTFDQINEARRALEDAYRDAGYFTVLVTVPEQEIDPRDGIVRLEVTEGKVDRLHVTGARFFSQRRIAEQLPSLAPGKVPTAEGFREDLTLLAARAPDRTLQPVAKAGREPGTVEFEVAVEDRSPFHFAMEVNDRFTIGTSRPRVSVNASYDNLWQREHSIGASYQFTPLEDEISAYSLSYTLRPGRSDRALSLYFLENSSDIATLNGDLTLGGGRTIGLRNITPLGVRGAFNHVLTTGLDYKDFTDDVDPGGPAEGEAPGTGDDVLTTSIDYLVLSAVYSGNYRAPRRGDRPSAANSFSLGLFGGVRGLMGFREEFQDKRFRAEPNFLYLTGNFSRNTPLTEKFSLFTRVAGQITGAPLVANEQMSLGGATSVRGYFLAEQLVDYGLVANFELRYVPPIFASNRLVSRLFLRSFADWGNGRIYKPLPEQQDTVTMSSVGLGMRAIGGGGGTIISLDWALALSDAAVAAPGQDPPGTQASDSRFHVSVRRQF